MVHVDAATLVTPVVGIEIGLLYVGEFGEDNTIEGGGGGAFVRKGGADARSCHTSGLAHGLLDDYQVFVVFLVFDGEKDLKSIETGLFLAFV